MLSKSRIRSPRRSNRSAPAAATFACIFACVSGSIDAISISGAFSVALLDASGTAFAGVSGAIPVAVRGAAFVDTSCSAAHSDESRRSIPSGIRAAIPSRRHPCSSILSLSAGWSESKKFAAIVSAPCLQRPQSAAPLAPVKFVRAAARASSQNERSKLIRCIVLSSPVRHPPKAAANAGTR